MPDDEHWVYQGRQEHGWFGSGTAPYDDSEDDAPDAHLGDLFDQANVGQRIDYAAYSLIGYVPRSSWRHPAANFDSRSREKLRTAVAAWYGASRLSRDAFRALLLDPSSGDATVNHLRAAARFMVEARKPATLSAASGDLAAAVKQVGLDRWPRYLGDANRRAVAAVSDGDIPGVVKVGDADAAAGVAGLVVLGVLGLIIHEASQPARLPGVVSAPAPPNVVQQDAPEDKKAAGDQKADGEAPPAASARPDWTPPPGGVVIPEDRRKYILDGDGKKRGGHGSGRNIPGKSEFPPDWSDDRIIEEIKNVANDPASPHEVLPNGRINVKGTRDGVDILVAIGRDKVTVVTAYPENMPHDPQR